MKRLSVHAVFAAAAIAAATLAAVQGVRLQRASALNAAIVAAAQAPTGVSTSASAAAGAASEPAPSNMPNEVPRDAPREVRLARATALSQAGAFDAAFKTYSGLIEPAALDGVGRHALYNLGTMYLRQAVRLQPTGGGAAPAASAEAGPLIELAKQRYRDLLRAAPDDWDARYNLERALRLAPEENEAVAEEAPTNVERRNVMLRGMDPGDLP
jgi:mxaK protein